MSPSPRPRADSITNLQPRSKTCPEHAFQPIHGLEVRPTDRFKPEARLSPNSGVPGRSVAGGHSGAKKECQRGQRRNRRSRPLAKTVSLRKFFLFLFFTSDVNRCRGTAPNLGLRSEGRITSRARPLFSVSVCNPHASRAE